MRYMLMLTGAILILFAGFKTYVVFHGSDIGPEMMADATLAAIGAIACFAIAAKLKGHRIAQPVDAAARYRNHDTPSLHPT
jgi:hypothetical protein